MLTRSRHGLAPRGKGQMVTLQAEYITDRRRLKRRMRLWRGFAVVTFLVAVFALYARNGPPGGLLFGDHIARVSIQGVITDDLKQQKLLARLTKSKRVKAVILRINSPGGTTTGSEALFASIRTLAKSKPVVAVLGTVAASGGYIAALGADHIVARGNTITGSIGVIFQWAQVTELLNKLGVKMKTIKSGPFKGQPSPFSVMTEDVRKATEVMVNDSFEWFVGLVSDRRPIDLAQARILADGRIYTGRIAAKNKLIDEVGGEEVALKWLQKKHRIKPGIKIVNWQVKPTNEFGFGSYIGRAFLQALGMDTLFGNLILAGKALKPERLNLDGLVSVWQPKR